MFRRVGSVGNFDSYDNRNQQPVVSPPPYSRQDTITTSIEDIEDVSTELNNELDSNSYGYKSMTVKQAIEQAQSKLKAFGISTDPVDYYYEEEESVTNLKRELEEMFANPVIDSIVESQRYAMSEKLDLIKSAGFHVGSSKPNNYSSSYIAKNVLGESAGYRQQPIRR